MYKVCVVTFYKRNYGAFLQAYALQKYLNKLGYNAEVLNYNYFKDRTVMGVYIGGIKKPIHFMKEIVYKLLRHGVSKKREMLMEKSAEQLIKQTKSYNSYKKLKKNVPDADVFIVGSDQVWNPNMSEQGLLSRLLDFAPADKAVLCSYAASLGVSNLSAKSQKLFKTHLERFDRISVREKKSVDIISNLTNKAINVHKDPTLLLQSSDWDKFVIPIETKKPYVFIYLAQNSNALVDYAIDLAKKNDWDIIDCHSSANYSIPNCVNGDKILTPMEFVSFIKNAEYVVTNSFHCLVFSIHYKRKAYVKLPPKGSERLSELIDNMYLNRITKPEQIKSSEVEMIYSKTEGYLSEERKNAEKYLAELGRVLTKKSVD
ncbi:MAG: polysaccharide pyruvyl transferase family protein [Ruminococcus sp.]|nr:polysaccharide pyruvyl transferase family protein [Ruminococcus sp.]